jgi:hypothetical protein
MFNFDHFARIASAAFLSLILTTVAVAGTIGSEGAGFAASPSYAAVHAESANG